MNLIWATRGRTWGFRLLRTGGLADALTVYEDAFKGLDGASGIQQGQAGTLAVRFADPEGRTDRAGRVIPHDLVVLDGDQHFDDLDAARAMLWPEIAQQFAAVWDQPRAPRVDEHR